MKLWSYWRSSCSYRVRIALNLKGLRYELAPVHLTRDGGEQYATTYRLLNPQSLLPALEVLPKGPVLTQSMAILEYLEERWPTPALLPAHPIERARARALAQCIAADTQPLQNLRVLRQLESTTCFDGGELRRWSRHWIAKGFDAVEEQLSSDTTYCFGDSPGLADVVLVPQVYNARRFGVDLRPYPRLCAIDEACRALPAFRDAAPEVQCDAPALRAVAS